MFNAYKGLNIEVDPENIPKLVSPSYRFEWKPGDVLHSGANPETDFVNKGITSSGPGFYSLKTPELVIKQGYWRPKRWSSVLAHIIPSGKVVEGDIGYRSEKATLAAVIKDDHSCDACDKVPGTTLVSKGTGSTLLLCNSCLQRLEKALPKSKFKKASVQETINALSKRYEVPIVKYQGGV